MDIDPARARGMSAGLVPARGADLFVRGRGGPIRLLAHFPGTSDERAPLLVLFTAAEAGTRHDLGRLAETVSQRAAAVVLVSVPARPAAGEATVGLDAAATILDWATDHADQLRSDADHLVVAGMGAAACLLVSLVAGDLPEFRLTVREQVLIHPPRDCLTRLERSASAATGRDVVPVPTTVVLPLQRPDPQDHHTWSSAQVIYSDDAASTLGDLITHRRTGTYGYADRG